MMNARIMSLILVGLLMGSIFVMFGTQIGTSYEVTNFGNPGTPTERVITLTGKAGSDDLQGPIFKDASTYLDLPIGKNVILPDSHLKVSAVNDGTGQYARDPSVDMGMDGDLEWAFSGEGYGDFGHQNGFSDDGTKKTLKYLSAGSNTNLKVKLPLEGQMDSAKFTLEGRLSSPTFNGYKLDIEQGLKNVRYLDTGDINGDGSVDVVATSANSDSSMPDLVWYENPNPPTTTEWKKHFITNNTNNAFKPMVVDLDGDGDMDVVMSTNSQNGGIRWFENKDSSVPGDGDGSQWEGGDSAHRIDNSNTINYARNFDVDDLDNDGDMDVAVSPYEYGNVNVFWFENTIPSSSTSWTRYQTYSSVNPGGQINDIVVSQINTTTSTRKDIIVANMYGPDYDIFWLENDGSPDAGSWNYHRINPPPPNSTYYYPQWIDAGDIDGDGRNDIAAAHYYSYGLFWYKCPSDPSNTTLAWNVSKIGQVYYPTDIQLGNINNDGDLDVVTTTGTSANGFKVHYFEQPATPTNQWTNNIVDTTLQGLAGIGIANLDAAAADTDNDILAVSKTNSKVAWYSNNGGAIPSFSIKKMDDAGINGPQGLFIADIDDDGDNDFFTTGLGGSEILWYENPSDPYDNSSWIGYTIATGFLQPWDIAGGYFNNDNYIDIAVTSHNNPNNGGGVFWFQHPGASVKSASSWVKGTVQSSMNYPSGIAVGDVDGDGDDDIMVSEEYSPYTLNYYDNANGQGTNWTRNIIGTNLRYYPTGVSMGDFNDDGILDAAVGFRYNRGYSLLGFTAPANPATGPWTQFTIDTNFYYIYDTLIVDIDGDGFDDVVATSSNSGINWYLNPAGIRPEWKEFTIHAESGFGGQFLWADDIGNDGYIDIVASSNNRDRIYWFEQPDNPEMDYTWEAYTVASGIDQARGIFISEVDGSGTADIVGVGYGDSEIWWYTANMVYPHDVKLNVGGKGAVDYTYSGQVLAPQETTNLATQFNEILTDVSTSWETDMYGNNLTEIYIDVYSPDASRVLVKNVNITYQYDAKIELNPHSTFLYNELNDIIPDSGTGNYSVNVCVQSYTPAKLKLSSVFIRYNNPPVLEKPIESGLRVLEGKSNSHLVDLHKYYSDDYDLPEELTYKIESNSRPDKVWALISLNKFVKISATKDNDWFGDFEVEVSATDSLGMKTISNKFKVVVDNDDDPPVIGDSLPNFEIPEGETTFLMNLNNSIYFNDFDSTRMYYRGMVDILYRQDLQIEFDADNNMKATALGDWFDNDVPVQIYADDEDLNTKSYDELENMDVFQDISIDVINVNDAPEWINFPNSISVEEDYRQSHLMEFRWVNLNDFVNDIDNTEFDLSYSVVKNTNSSFIKITIDMQDLVHIDNALVDNYDGQTQVVIRVSDGLAYADVPFTIKTIPINDRPTISVLSPADRSTVSGMVNILGNAYDLEGLDKVMVNINNGGWTKVTGTTNWQFLWNTLNYADGDYTMLFRAYDNDPVEQKISNSAVLHLKIYNALSDPDGDGYFGDADAFPSEASQWSDTDGDGYGDNPTGFEPDIFPEDPLENIDTDGDGYGDRFDKFPYDMTQWNDSDDDGYGDNLWGNNPDPLPDNPDVPGKVVAEEVKEEVAGESTITFLWNLVVIILIIVVILSVVFAKVYKPKAP